MLESIIKVSKTSRRLAMTATPIELDESQWSQMLSRIKVNQKEINSILESVQDYASVVRKIRACPTNVEIRKEYAENSRKFQDALSPYLLRRDKRQDHAVKEYVKVTKMPYETYRKKTTIDVDLQKLDPNWRHSICAAEALSIVTSGLKDKNSEELKRLRITIGNGHGIAAMVDQSTFEDNSDEIDDSPIPPQKSEENSETGQSKKLERALWWGKIMQRPFADQSGDEIIYGHPAIQAAIEEIEKVTLNGEKVLVFGKYTRPLRCLVRLLNARAMLRTLFYTQQFWPQASVSPDDVLAVNVAVRQLKFGCTIDQVNEKLGYRYSKFKQSRERFRDRIREIVAQMMENKLSHSFMNSGMRSLFYAFEKTIAKNSEQETNSLGIVARALSEFIDEDGLNSSDASEIFIREFTNIITALSDRDELNADIDADSSADPFDADKLWPILFERLEQEFKGNQAKYSQIMFGETSQSSRRMIQLAFNRPKSSCRVLVAQSMVGREGLNLHKECKTVVLLHPEWNPGVVEQQIGRIDRVGSYWQRELEKEIQNSEPINIQTVPRINIRPVIFKGTYDEYNWKVLESRWSDLRAQLHGVIINGDISSDEELRCIYDEISKNTPNFSPDNLESYS